MKTHVALRLMVAALAIGLFARPLVPQRAWAAITYCRSDPRVYLSNGVQIDITATISADASSVRSVSYVLHAPAGTSVTSIVYTGGLLTGKENFTFHADQAGNVYVTGTTVSASQNVPVTAQTSAVSNSGASSGSASGYTNQLLSVQV